MKKTALFFSLLICSLASAQIINFPDPNFKNLLTTTNCVAFEADFPSAIDADTNNDGEIDENEAQSVQHLRINGGGIIDLTGIENFTNLLSIRITNNLVTSIDLSSNLNLIEIYCVNNSQLTDLTLGNNSNLVELNCKTNQLQSLDVSNNINLETLICYTNQLVNLDVSANINLEIFEFGDNMIDAIDLSANLNLGKITLFSLNTLLTSIDISNNINLVNFSCSYSSITTLDVSNNPNLLILSCSGTQIPSLDLASNPLLRDLWCDDMQITSLDLSNNLNLENLTCDNTPLQSLNLQNNMQLDRLTARNCQLSSLDLSQNVALVDLFLDSNNLTTLDLSNNPNLESFWVTDNPQLTYINAKNGNNTIMTQISLSLTPGLDNLQAICVDDPTSTLWTTYINSPSSPVVTEYCTFTPGGDFNTITGDVIFDSQNNGCDSNDDAFPFIKMSINDGMENGATFTNNSGEYNFYTQDGTFTVTSDLENSSFFNVTPIDAIINFPDTNNNIEIQDFCITANGVHPDIEIAIAPTIPARPGFDAEYLITYKNKGNQTVSGDVTFTYDDAVLDYLNSTETPTTQTTGELSWDYSNLLPFESRSIYVILNVNSPMETPAVNIDDQLDFTATANPLVGDDLPLDNVFNYEQIVVGSYDPNDITCIQGDIVEPSEIGNYLHYIINFENTGNAAAENVVVKTEIDPTQFDVNTLQLLSSSHNADVRVKNNKVEFIFENIQLAASGGHGNILLRMQTKGDLQTNDTVTKDAQIFFDYNFPIQTNDANTTFAALSNPEFELDNSISLYPNPVKDILSIKANNVIKSISVYDVQGRLLQTKVNSNTQIELNLSTRSKGVYFVKIITKKGTNVEKIIKD